MAAKNNKKINMKKITNKIKNSKLSFSLIEVLTITLVAILLGVLIGGIITYDKENVVITKIPEELEEFVNTYNNIYSNYYKKVEKKDLINAAMEGMINSLDDPYSVYMETAESKAFNETVSGEYVGIGATVKYGEEYAEISAMFNNSPAKNAGMEIGDKIIEIDGQKVQGKELSKITKLIKGKEGTTLKIKIIREKEEKEFTLKRSTISVPSVESKVLEKNNQKVGYISIDVFSANTYKQFKSKLNKLESQKIKSLILDVRSNPGGHLDQVTNILELFLPKNKVLYQIQQKDNTQKVLDVTKEKRNYKVAVLINKSSASASEILASSLKESYKATLIGKTSYGKGTVQKAFELSSGATLKYTTQKWLTPDGNWINEKGIIPDEEIDLDEEYLTNPSIDTDNQLQKALDIMTKKEED